ncbi:hypothetical protein NO263_03335 [Gluconacetobacter entanii]|uniref:Phage head morphogenesis domain-containing protein n=2 Tax=Acetobacteraceae TaxID=433 RepID=A0ABQ0SFT5_NOVHA|nr:MULTISPECIES: hypothetical protein [Acetobacteraceae]MCW4589608.1 hypothetical protein [Gluconacetobacter entanii]MCW4593034.1 hypothetical protein [Gluconacetobacter entanii]NPC89186.1 hypothetical protein [Gluconacetobacter entanii]GAN83828.1 hypothetical protein Gaha_0105_063 [Novacetimonas hansenii JCM 7643]GBQ62812.1 hypothetical protein AA0243_2972 [Novacetimonas hansenii NRIC 0243]
MTRRAEILVDIGGIASCQCDDALESLFKAATETPARNPTMLWDDVPNPIIRRLVELFTQKYQAVLKQLQDRFGQILTGKGTGSLQKALSPGWGRWTPEQEQEARAHLERHPPEDYTLDDWMLLVELLMQEYLPHDVAVDWGDWLTVRATLAGKAQAAFEARGIRDAESIAKMAEYMPTGFGAVPRKILTPVEMKTIEIARARAAENISAVTDVARHKMKNLIIQHMEAQMFGMKQGQFTALRQSLFDAFGELNRDFRRIAVTEAGEACNQGLIATLSPGQRVKRVEAYRGACAFCKSINGKIFTVVAPDAPEQNGQTQVWVGKTNIGRSAASRRRTDEGLMPRSENEMWWPAAGVQHPNCRGSWVTVTDPGPDVSPEFVNWMDGILRKHSLKPVGRPSGQQPT